MLIRLNSNYTNGDRTFYQNEEIPLYDKYRSVIAKNPEIVETIRLKKNAYLDYGDVPALELNDYIVAMRLRLFPEMARYVHLFDNQTFNTEADGYTSADSGFRIIVDTLLKRVLVFWRSTVTYGWSGDVELYYVYELVNFFDNEITDFVFWKEGQRIGFIVNGNVRSYYIYPGWYFPYGDISTLQYNAGKRSIIGGYYNGSKVIGSAGFDLERLEVSPFSLENLNTATQMNDVDNAVFRVSAKGKAAENAYKDEIGGLVPAESEVMYNLSPLYPDPSKYFGYIYRVRIDGVFYEIPEEYIIEIDSKTNTGVTGESYKQKWERDTQKDSVATDGDYVKATKETLGIDISPKAGPDKADYANQHLLPEWLRRKQ